jgi:hypothetical protein
MQSRHRPWLRLLACLVASGGVTAQVGAQQDANSATAEMPPGAPAAPAETAGSGLGLNLRGAPILTSGFVSYDLRAGHAAGETKSISQLVTTSLSARSYIYQPWFATLNGTLGVSMGRSREAINETAAQDPFASQASLASRDRFVTGNARLDLFPVSRFPFEVHVERADSRVDTALASSLDFSTQNIGFSQRYQPASHAFSLTGSFDRRQQTAAGFRDTQNQFVGDFATRWKYHELSLGLSYSEAQRQLNKEQTQFLSLVGRHQYSPASALSVNTTVNWTQTEEQATTAPSEVSLLQLSSVGLWHRDGSSLTLTGAVRGLLLRDKLSEHALDTFGLTMGAAYELNKNTRLTANGNATSTNTNGARGQGVSGSVGAGWQADTIDIRDFHYDLFTSGSAGGSVSSFSDAGTSTGTPLDAGFAVNGENETQTTLGLQLGHTLSRTWPITPQSALVLNGGQTLAVSKNHSSHSDQGSIPNSSRTLLQTIAATWNTAKDGRSGLARASYSDSMELGGSESRFQLVNFQLSGNFNFDRSQSLGGDLTLQRVAQRSGDLQQPDGLGLRTSSTGASGEITYRQQRLFGIPRLRFSSRLKLAQDVLKQAGTFTTIPDRETRLWENRLDWRVGRLDTQLMFRISEVDGKRRNFLMLRVQRSFGD